MELGYKASLVMAVGVAALLVFTRCNITGPLDNIPLMPLVELSVNKDDLIEWEAWAHEELVSVGSELLAKFSNSQYLIFGKTADEDEGFAISREFLFNRWIKKHYMVVSRALFLHQKLLDEHSSVLFDLLQVFVHESLLHLGTLEKIKGYWCANEDCSTILTMLHLEFGILELYYGCIDSSKLHIELAGEMSNYNCFVSGAMGFRTRHRVEPKAQLHLVAGTNGADTSAPLTHDSSIASSPQLGPISEADEASDVLMAPRFVGNEGDSKSVEQDSQYHAIGASQLKQYTKQ